MHSNEKTNILSGSVDQEDIYLKKEWLQEHEITTMRPEKQQIFLTLRKICDPKDPFKYQLDPDKERLFRRRVINIVRHIYDLHQKSKNSNDIFFQWDNFLKEIVNQSTEDREEFFNAVWFLFHHLSLHCYQGRDLNHLLICLKAITDTLSSENRFSIDISAKCLNLIIGASLDEKDNVFESCLKCIKYIGAYFLDSKTLSRCINSYSDSIKKDFFDFLTKMPKYRYINICYFFSKTATDNLTAHHLMRCILQFDDKKKELLISRLYYLSKTNSDEIKKEIESISAENGRLLFYKIKVLYRQTLKNGHKNYLKKWSSFCLEKITEINNKKYPNENPLAILTNLLSDKAISNNKSFKLYTCSDPNIFSEKIFVRYPKSIPELYGIIFWQTSIVASQLIKHLRKEKNIYFQDILHFLSISRQEIENIFREESPEDKESTLNDYGNFRFKKSIKVLDDRSLLENVYFKHVHTPFRDYIDKNNKVFGVSDLEPKDLVLVDHPSKKGQKIKLTESYFKKNSNLWIHFKDRENYDDVLLHLEKLFQLSLEPQESLDKLLENLGRLYWWLSHACLFARGSASISEMLITALLLRHGWLHSFWKKGICMDVVALCCSSEDDFVKYYYNKNFLRHELRYLNVSIDFHNNIKDP